MMKNPDSSGPSAELNLPDSLMNMRLEAEDHLKTLDSPGHKSCNFLSDESQTLQANLSKDEKISYLTAKLNEALSTQNEKSQQSQTMSDEAGRLKKCLATTMEMCQKLL